MNWISLITFFLAFSTVVYTEDDGSNAVLRLTDATFDDTVKNNPVIMVKFFAPGCAHCKALKPEYKKAAQIAKDQGKSYVFADIDATAHPNTAEKYEIQAYPTVKLFINEYPVDYEGERKAEAILSFIDKKSGPPSVELNADQLKEKKAGKGLRSILVSDNQATIKEYQDIVRHMEEYDFYHTSVKAGQEVFPGIKEGQVVILKDYDEGMAVLEEKFMEDESKLHDFLLLHMFPTVTGLSEKALEQVLSGNDRKGVFLFRSENDPESKKIDEEFRKVATAMRSKEYLFFQTDIKGSLGQQIADTFGVDTSSLPVLQSAELKEETMMYRHQGPLTEESIKDFIDKWQTGALPRFYTSEPIPQENPGPIYKVVGKSFKSEVIDNDLDVLVKFYAPWCEFSKMLEPIYKKLAEAMKDNKRVKFCEIDATKNDVEGYPLEGYPTIKFFPGKDKSAAFTYDGDLTEDALAKFIEENTNSPVNLPQQTSNEEAETQKQDL